MTSPISTDLGSDLPVEEFRALAHEVADWAADYLGGVGSLPVLPGVRPGDVRSALPATPPLQGESLTEVLSDFRDVIVPGLTHWNHPSFFGYFAMTGSGPGILAENTKRLSTNSRDPRALARSNPGRLIGICAW